MQKLRIGLVISLCSIGLACAGTGHRTGQGFDLYIVRHAETMANVTKEYTDENQSRFSPKGQAEVRELAQQLGAEKIDRVLVSPTIRTLKTIAPYLEQQTKQAEIWPELEECCWQDARGVGRINELPRGARVQVDEAIEPLFQFRSEDRSHWYDARTVEESDFVVALAVEVLKQRFGHSGKKVVVVSHFNVGQKLIGSLTEQGDGSSVILEPGKITHLRQDRDGLFRIVKLNGEPLSLATP